MTTYYQAIKALEYLLDKSGETRWRDWLRQDIFLWETKKDVEHHLSAYGAMGSINDVWISVQNGHSVTKIQEPWVDTLFELMKGLCYRLAENPNKDEFASDIGVGRYLPILKASKNNLDNGREIDNVANQAAEALSALSGWRCLKCGYSETNSYDIDCYLAKIVLPQYLSSAITEAELKGVVDAAFRIDFDMIDSLREQLNQTILDSEIQISQNSGWMRPCPKCGDNDTAVYRWEKVPGTRTTFHPSKGNLPLRKKAA